MKRTGPVVVIEDDTDDQQLLAEIFSDLGYSNKIEFFTDGQSALTYLSQEDVMPFIILSDINMPGLDGFELRDKVLSDDKLNSKCVPYLFMSTSVTSVVVQKAYKMSVQGFFEKPVRYEELQNTVKAIMEYWTCCYAPN